jgi:hypothetical protein
MAISTLRIGRALGKVLWIECVGISDGALCNAPPLVPAPEARSAKPFAILSGSLATKKEPRLLRDEVPEKFERRF